MSVSVEYESDFWFTLSAEGAIEGRAVTRYRMASDDSQLRGLIQIIKSGPGAAVATLPLVSGLLGVVANQQSLHEIVGLRPRYDEGMPVREGRIRGRVSNGEMHIAWSDLPSALPYQDYRVYLTREETTGEKATPAYSGWNSDARMMPAAAGEWNAIVPADRVHQTTGNVSITNFWLAYRVR